MSAHGHFFCEHCDDVVNVPPELRPLAKCPVCHHLTAHWVPDEPLPAQRQAIATATTAALWFAKMHEVVNAAG